MPNDIENEGVAEPVPYDFPKVELHCHLDGCFRVPTIVELAKKHGVPLPTYDEIEVKKYITLTSPCNTLREYLNPFYFFEPVFAGNAEALARIAREAVEDKAKDGITYIEFRYSPLLLANCDVKPVVHAKTKGTLRPKDVVEIVSKSLNETAAEFDNMRVKTILSDICGHNGWSQQTAALCREYEHLGVVGFDIAGAEGSEEFGPDHVQGFQYCKMNGIHRTAHAGEAGTAYRVKMALEQLGAERVGHGYHSVDDDEVYGMVKRQRTHLEVCPLSSRYTYSVPRDWSLHPAIRFFADDVNFSLSTDDPGLQQTTLIDDYDIASREWNFTVTDLQKLNLNAARSCFLDFREREQLVSDLEKSYGKLADDRRDGDI